MTTQVRLTPGETRPEIPGGGAERGGFSGQGELRKPVSSTPPEDQNGAQAKAALLLLLALDVFDSLLANAPALPDPDHDAWRAALSPWIEDLAPARKHVDEALNSLGVERIGARREPFDPAWHEVVATEKSSAELATQHVIRVIRPGFRLGAFGLRRARVVVTVQAS